MARIIEEAWPEHATRCRHCGAKIGYTADDVVNSTYIRGLDYPGGEGWIDADCLWHYIECPKCGGYVCVTGDISQEEDDFLTQKYNME